MVEADLTQILDVDIDKDGVFKYVLIPAHSVRDGQDCPSNDIVHGYKWVACHADIYDQVSEEIQKKVFDYEFLGGRTISHQSQDKKINVYGYSMGCGHAQHSLSTEKIKAHYLNYEVTRADDGY
ncbi:14 kDa phosphohistidine phosphatase-like [Petaurus breviceps papuanus]|uniref:14 kDa phosphohistidine phosphatase-like n=1 Tax=Petaurus breviceps papuanus TaxID=3040969 RepID=UPI0036DBC71F